MDLAKKLVMKKSFLLITVLIYFFSILAEIGIFDSLHAKVKSRESSISKISISLIKKVDQTLKSSGHLSDIGGCTESTCHTGHCHHLSVLNLNPQTGFANQVAKNGSNFQDNYFFQYDRVIKRPPRNS